MSNKNKSDKNNLNKVTTIKLREETKQRLEKLREHKKESYDDILRKILYILNVTRAEPDKARKILEKISEIRERRLKELKEDIKKEY